MSLVDQYFDKIDLSCKKRRNRHNNKFKETDNVIIIAIQFNFCSLDSVVRLKQYEQIYSATETTQ